MTDLIILTGLLGSGKTTTLKNILATSPKDKKIAVIVNEFASYPVDGKLIDKEKYKVKELGGGCICCSLSKDLQQQITELKDSDVIILETSGVAQLPPLIGLAEETGVNLKGIVTVVDASRELNEMAKEQVRLSSLTVVNKTDLAEPDMELIQSLEPQNVVKTKMGKIKYKDIKAVKKKYTGKYDEKHLRGISSLSYSTDGKLDREKFEKLFSKNMHRAKGFVTFDKSYHFNYASGLLNYEESDMEKTDIVFIGKLNTFSKIILLSKLYLMTDNRKASDFFKNFIDIGRTAE